MKTHGDKDWELSLDPDTIRLFILKARAISAALNHDYAAGAEHEIELDGRMRDSHQHDGLAEEEEEDLTTKELRELIGDLNVDEIIDLVALTWMGRGDYEEGEWQQARDDARHRNPRKTADYLLGMPQLAEWLEAGLETIGA